MVVAEDQPSHADVDHLSLYVVLFSFLIYFIGYKLRAGQTEWNELQVVDVLPQGTGSQAALRGWTFGSLYSPANETHTLGSSYRIPRFAANFADSGGAAGEPVRMTVTERPHGFGAEVFVPVWTSAMTVADWEDSGAALQARTLPNGAVEIRNSTGRRLGPVWVVGDNRVIPLAELPASSVQAVDFRPSAGTPLTDLTAGWEADFKSHSVSESKPSGREKANRRWPEASRSGELPVLYSVPERQLRLARRVRPGAHPAEGDRVVLAWMPDTTLTAPLNQFETLRTRKGTLLRLVVSAVPQP